MADEYIRDEPLKQLVALLRGYVMGWKFGFKLDPQGAEFS